MMNLSIEQKNQFNEILGQVTDSLDISETEYNAAVQSYKAVGGYLSNEDSALAPYEPTILPQGSFLIGTVIKPISKKCDLDLDLVCQLKNKNISWTQADIKKIIGNQLKKHKTFDSLLDKEGRRCWTLKYRQNSSNGGKYHMDILPAIVSNGFGEILEKAFSYHNNDNFEQLSIRITDNEMLPAYYISTNVYEWLKSNPFGFASWFLNQADLNIAKSFSLREVIKPVPVYQKERLPLQRVVQILKRHRDVMFNDDKEKPISIIITTLAGRAYQKEPNIIDALFNVVHRMEVFIENKIDIHTGEEYKFIGNPVNSAENFADKWKENKNKEEKFYKWIDQVKLDIQTTLVKRSIPLIAESMKKPFGEELINKAFNSYGDSQLLKRESGNMKMAKSSGILGSLGTIVKGHNFHGK